MVPSRKTAVNTPFSRATRFYLAEGWPGCLLPMRSDDSKHPAVAGRHGKLDRNPFPTLSEIRYWAKTMAECNVSLRVPVGMIAIDVDDHSDKPGGQSFKELIAKLGELPTTYRSTSRGVEGVSGVYLFRAELPEETKWNEANAGPGIELVHAENRYITCWPSIHPRTGNEYRWYMGDLAIDAPTYENVPELPSAWIEALTAPRGPERSENVTEIPPKFTEGQSGTRYGLGGLRRELAHLKNIWDDNKEAFNPQLNTSVFKIAGLVSGGEIEASYARSEIEDLMAVLSVPAGQYKTLESGWKAGLLNPRISDKKEPAVPQPTKSPEEAEGDARSSHLESALLKLRGNTYTADTVDDIPESAYLVKYWLYKREFTRLVGGSGVGKSFFMLDMAIHVALGLSWRGYRVRKGTVLYLAAEGQSGIRRRIRAWEKHYGIKIENLHILTLPVKIVKGMDYRTPIESYEWKALKIHAKELGADLIVLDTQARIAAGLEENSATEMGVMVDACEEMRDETGACVLLVHHTGIGDNGRARGSSAVFGALATEITLTIDKKGVRKVLNPKQKELEKSKPMFFDLQQIDLWEDEDGDMVTSAVAVPMEYDEAIESYDEDDEGATPSSGKQDSIIEVVKRAEGGVLALPAIIKNLGLDENDPKVIKRVRSNADKACKSGKLEKISLDSRRVLYRAK